MTVPDPCGGDVKGGGGCVCDPPFADRPTRIVGNDAARFLSKVEQTEGCWLWRGTVASTNPVFGIVTPGGKRMVQAARWLHEHAVGPIPAGHRMASVCGQSLCVRPYPSHRWPMSVGDLNRLLTADGRRPLVTHCVHGHEYTPENTRVKVAGHRVCRACQRIRGC